MSENQDWFVFRGKRDYLHSTTLFDYLVAEYAGNAGVQHHIDFIFVRKTNCICRVEVTNQGNSGLVASYCDDNRQYYVYETDRLIERREPYSEPVEGDAYLIAGECVSIPGACENNSFIELAVAAYKGLLTSIFPEFGERYVFARMKLDRIPASSFEVCYKRKIAKHFFEGEISVEGTAVGLIYYGI